jgi:hypothetical protein
MFTRHQLTCQRAGCGRAFTATRSDALYCSRRCRRDKSTPATALPIGNGPAVEEAPAPVGSAVLSEDDIAAGWRVMPGGLIAPPPDPNLTFRLPW